MMATQSVSQSEGKLSRRMYSNYRYDKHYFDQQFGKKLAGIKIVA